MVIKMKKILQILILLSIVEIGVVFAYSEPVGVVDLNNSMILTWNQGMIANETYFNKSMGLLQHANTIERSDDVTYIYGIARNVSGTMAYWGMESNPGGIITNKTDFSTYYWLNNRIVRTNGPGQFTLDKNHSQNLNDDHVTISFVASANRDYSGEFYVSHGFRNLDINNDKVSETFNFVHGNGSLETWDNRSGDFWFDNVTRIVIDGGVGSYSYDLNFSLGVKMRINHSSPSTNPDITFYSYIGNIVRDQVYKYEYKWIDAVCSSSCPLNCVIQGTQTNISDGQYSQGTFFKNVGCRYMSIGLSCGISGCTVSADCRMEWRQYINGYSDNTLITYNDTNNQFKCANSPSCFNTSMSNAVYKYQNLISSAVGETDMECFQQYGASSFAGGGFSNFIISREDVDLFLDVPTNARNESNNWTVFRSNWTGNKSPDNMSLYINNTLNYTQGGGNNLTTNLSWDYFASWTWGVLACYSHNCVYAQLGNRSFFKHYYPNLIYWSPLNNSNLSEYSSYRFGMNNSGNSTIGNISLYINGTLNKTVDEINFSQIISIDFYGNTSWNGKICLWNECKLGGVNSFVRNVISGPVSSWIPDSNLTNDFIIFKDEPKKDHIENVPDWAIYGIAGIIILMGLSATVISHYQNKRRDDAERYSNEP